MVLPSVEEAAAEGPAQAALQAPAIVRWARGFRCFWPEAASKEFESPIPDFAAAHQLATAVSPPPPASAAPCLDKPLPAIGASESENIQTGSPAHSARSSTASRWFPTIGHMLFQCPKVESSRPNQ